VIAAAALASGLVFALGLGLGGMTQPAKVVAFVDVGGDWDPSLVCVMAAALVVHSLLARLVLRRPAPVLAPRFVLPKRTDLDRPLIAGAALFGVGWGLAGFCPGPAMTTLGAGMPEALVFVPAMLAGMAVEHLVERRRASVASSAATSAAR
jgi:uncharacterized membrane protein YedE/YeeE